jgi:exodeoxyribonuclease VII small subunit
MAFVPRFLERGGLGIMGWGLKMKNFEERLERLEVLGDKIRRPELPLDEALKSFEEGIKLARSLEKDLEKVESRVEILMNSAGAADDEKPVFELFDAVE